MVFFSYLVEGTQKKMTRKISFSFKLNGDLKTINEAMDIYG